MFDSDLATLIGIVAGLALIVLFAWLFNPTEANEKRLDAWRSEAERAFTALEVPSTDPAFAFRGDMADVVEQTEAISRDDSGRMYGYTLKRFARNEAGEYFMFVSNSDGKPPFFKHVPQANARIALKAKYVAPPGR